MKQQLQNLIKNALKSLCEQYSIELESNLSINIDNARDKKHGDYATNIAMVVAKSFKKSPKIIAESIIEIIKTSPLLTKAEIAGPGFINFFISDVTKTKVIADILKAKSDFGKSTIGAQKRIILEYVSANPTGPLHVGHGRATAIGASLANILKSQGFNVHQEYYVNDAGRQMDILAVSVYLRYLALFNNDVTFPSNAYKGDYIKDIAESLKANKKMNLLKKLNLFLMIYHKMKTKVVIKRFI